MFYEEQELVLISESFPAVTSAEEDWLNFDPAPVEAAYARARESGSCSGVSDLYFM